MENHWESTKMKQNTYTPQSQGAGFLYFLVGCNSYCNCSKVNRFCIYQFLCIHFGSKHFTELCFALSEIQTSHTAVRGSEQGQQQDHINQIITESSGTEAIETLTSHFPSNLSSQLSKLFVFLIQSLAFPHFECFTQTTLYIKSTSYTYHLGNTNCSHLQHMLCALLTRCSNGF